MSEYESVLANQVQNVFRTQMDHLGYEVLPVNTPDLYTRVGKHLHIDDRAGLIPHDNRRSVQWGVDVGDCMGRSQMTAVFDGKIPVAVFTFVIEAPINIGRLEYVRVEAGIGKRFSFGDIYGVYPNHLIVPGYTEVSPNYRSRIRQPGFMAMSQSLELLMTSFEGDMVEMVAQGNDKDIGVPRRSSASVIKWAELLGMKCKERVGAIPSLGPVFYRHTKH